MFSSNYTPGVISPKLAAKALGSGDDSGSKPPSTTDSKDQKTKLKKAPKNARPSRMVCIDHLPAGMTVPKGVQIGNCDTYKPPAARQHRVKRMEV